MKHDPTKNTARGMLGIIRFFKETRIFIVAVLKFNINKKLQVLILKSTLANL